MLRPHVARIALLSGSLRPCLAPPVPRPPLAIHHRQPSPILGTLGDTVEGADEGLRRWRQRGDRAADWCGSWLAAGHEVVGMTRREERAEEIRAAGAAAVVCDVFDAEALERGRGCRRAGGRRPRADRAASSLRPRKRTTWRRPTGSASRGPATSSPPRRLPARSGSSARASPSAYGPEGGWVKERGGSRCSPTRRAASAPPSRRLSELERQVLEAEGAEGARAALRLVLRPRHLLRPRRAAVAEEVEKRRLPIVGTGQRHLLLRPRRGRGARDRRRPRARRSGIYNVVDDEPAPLREWVPVYAEALGAKPPRRVPVWLARFARRQGRRSTAAGACAAPTNAKAKRELGWRPAHPSWRQGFGEASLK